MKYISVLGAVAFGVAASAATGCGLVDGDVTRFDISLPQKTVSVDADQWELNGMATFPDVPCSSQPSICTQSADQFCTAENCSPACDGASCQVTVAINLFKDFDLKTENPALQELDDQALISVSISRIFFEVPQNTFSVATPTLEVYLAPATVMSPTDPDAERIGSIPSVPAQTTISEGELEIDDTGEDTIRRFLEDWSKPFNVIVSGEVVVSAGDTVPTGKLDAAVRVNASAGLD